MFALSEEELKTLLGKSGENIPLDGNLFSLGYVDSLTVVELLERLSALTGTSALDLAGDLDRLSTLRKILALANDEPR